MNTERKKLPYDEGYEAAMEGRPESDNPYAIDDWRHQEWEDGFDNVMAGRSPDSNN